MEPRNRELDPRCWESKKEERESKREERRAVKEEGEGYRNLRLREEEQLSPPCATGEARQPPERYVCGSGVWSDKLRCFPFFLIRWRKKMNRVGFIFVDG